MGEIADMMLDGTLCECCGEYIGRNLGYPGYCSRECAEARGMAAEKVSSNRSNVFCPICRKRVKAVGLKDHVRDVHKKQLAFVDDG